MQKQRLEALMRSLEQEKTLHSQSKRRVEMLMDEIKFLNRCIDVISGRTGITISINEDIALIRKAKSKQTNEVCIKE